MAQKKRIKSDKPALIEVRDWAHADKLIRQIADHQTIIEKLEAGAKLKIENSMKVLTAGAKSHHEMIKKYQESLEAFATTHRADFKKQKSRKLNFGILGWRFSTSIGISTKHTLGLIKEKLSEELQESCIIIKESVSKDALANLTDEQLASVKARRDEKDVFFVEPASIKAADYNK